MSNAAPIWVALVVGVAVAFGVPVGIGLAANSVWPGLVVFSSFLVINANQKLAEKGLPAAVFIQAAVVLTLFWFGLRCDFAAKWLWAIILLFHGIHAFKTGEMFHRIGMSKAAASGFVVGLACMVIAIGGPFYIFEKAAAYNQNTQVAEKPAPTQAQSEPQVPIPPLGQIATQASQPVPPPQPPVQTTQPAQSAAESAKLGRPSKPAPAATQAASAPAQTTKNPNAMTNESARTQTPEPATVQPAPVSAAAETPAAANKTSIAFDSARQFLLNAVLTPWGTFYVTLFVILGHFAIPKWGPPVIVTLMLAAAGIAGAYNGSVPIQAIHTMSSSPMVVMKGLILHWNNQEYLKNWGGIFLGCCLILMIRPAVAEMITEGINPFRKPFAARPGIALLLILAVVLVFLGGAWAAFQELSREGIVAGFPLLNVFDLSTPNLNPEWRLTWAGPAAALLASLFFQAKFRSSKGYPSAIYDRSQGLWWALNSSAAVLLASVVPAGVVLCLVGINLGYIVTLWTLPRADG